jgi:osmoprotectant transport system ATP-binding protein
LSAVRFEDVAVRYAGADRNAIDGITLEIEDRSFTVLLGPSGCGKSTLLRTVNRLVIPQSGRVLLHGTDTAAMNPVELRRSIGYVIQAVGLFSHMTVAQNVGVVPSLLRWRRDELVSRVDELLVLVGLDPSRYRSRYPRELSGGEAQRVGVARALAARPPVLLMDEPFGAVDAIVRASLQEELLRITRQLHTTVIFVTHDVDEALRLADSLAVMREGRLEQHATPAELLASPASPFVAHLFSLDPRMRAYDDLRSRLASS